MKLRHALALALASASMSAHATNWFQAQNTEPPNAKLYRVFGLLQPTYTRINGDNVTGLKGTVAPHNGQTPVFINPALKYNPHSGPAGDGNSCGHVREPVAAFA